MNCVTKKPRPSFFVSLSHYNNESRSSFSNSGDNWSNYYILEDFPLSIRGDIAIDKSNVISQYIAFFYQKPDLKWYIMIKTGLGATT
jgi:hypothetical protein